MLAEIIFFVFIVIVIVGVLIALVRDRGDAPPVAHMESGRSHLDEGGAHRNGRAAKREARKR